MTHMGLFEGIGGFSLAGRWAGWDTPVMVEWNKYCQAVLQKNFPNASIFGNIHEFDGRPYAGQIDIITGGFPCQPYSHAGLRKGNDDDRALWPEMLRVIREVGPEWVVGENVAGLVSMDGGRVFGGILADLENAGYRAQAYIIPAVGVQAPHERYRVWIVAHGERTGLQREQHIQGTEMSAKYNFAAANPQSEQDYRQEFGWVQPEFTRSHRGHKNGAAQNAVADAKSQRFGKEGEYCGRQAERVARKDSALAADPGCRNGQNGRHGGQPAELDQTDEHGDGRNGHHWQEHWYEVATRICRVADGLPAGVDGIGALPAKAKKGKGHRLEALGNAIVPQVAYQIFKAINSHEQHQRNSCNRPAAGNPPRMDGANGGKGRAAGVHC